MSFFFSKSDKIKFLSSGLMSECYLNFFIQNVPRLAENSNAKLQLRQQVFLAHRHSYPSLKVETRKPSRTSTTCCILMAINLYKSH